MLFTTPTILLLSSAALISAWEIHSVSDVTPRDHRNSGRGTSECINRNHKKEDKLRFSREGSSCCLHIYKEVDCNLNQSNENNQSICRDYNKDIDFHFRSYYVDCDGRGVNNPTPPATGSYSNSPPPYSYNPQPYNNNPQPYSSNPQPYSSNPQPYNSNPQPYSSNPQPYSSNPQPYNSNPQPYGNSPQPYSNSPQPYSYSPQPYSNSPPPYNSNPQPYSSNPPSYSSGCRPGDRCYVKEEAEMAGQSEAEQKPETT